MYSQQFVEDLVHLEGGPDGLDQHRGADRAVPDAEALLAEDRTRRSTAGPPDALHLRQVEVRAAAPLEQFSGLWKKYRPKSTSARPPASRRTACAARRSANRGAGPRSPPAPVHGQPVALLPPASQGEGAADGVGQVRPARRSRCATAGCWHPPGRPATPGPREFNALIAILRLRRPGDLHPPVDQVRTAPSRTVQSAARTEAVSGRKPNAPSRAACARRRDRAVSSLSRRPANRRCRSATASASGVRISPARGTMGPLTCTAV